LNINLLILHCLVILAYYIIHKPFHQTTNNPPSVRIIVPEEGAVINISSSVRFQVTVSDEEDGSTEYGEIQPYEVHLELSCWPGVNEANDYRKSLNSNAEDSPGLQLIKRSDCFNCHQDKTRLMGPSFEEIAGRYESNSINISNLADNIIHGSTGTWGDVQMPPNPELSRDHVLQAVKYIIEQGGNKNSCVYSGYEGSIRPIKPTTDSCVYVLGAFYTDKGKEQMPGTSLRGQHLILLNRFH
jgi:cytochrome c